MSEVPRDKPASGVAKSTTPVIAVFNKETGKYAFGPDTAKKKLVLTHRSERVSDDLLVELKLWNVFSKPKRVFKLHTRFYDFKFVALSGDQTVPYGKQPSDGKPPVVDGYPGPTEEDSMTIPVGSYVGTQFLFSAFYAKAKNFPIRLQVEGLAYYGSGLVISED